MLLVVLSLQLLPPPPLPPPPQKLKPLVFASSTVTRVACGLLPLRLLQCLAVGWWHGASSGLHQQPGGGCVAVLAYQWLISMPVSACVSSEWFRTESNSRQQQEVSKDLAGKPRQRRTRGDCRTCRTTCRVRCCGHVLFLDAREGVAVCCVIGVLCTCHTVCT